MGTQIELQDADIILVRVNKFSTWYRWLFASLIKFFDQCFYHHGQQVCNGKITEADIIVREVDFAHNNGDQVQVWRLKNLLTESELVKFKELTNEFVGRKYDWWSALLFQPIYIITGRRVWLGKKGIRANHRPYCIELPTAIMNQIRGYFPEHYLIGPSRLRIDLNQYYDLVYEGIWNFE